MNQPQKHLFTPDFDRFYQALALEPEFDGAFYDSYRDKERLTKKQLQLFELMKDGIFRSIPNITDQIGGTQTGTSAGVRNFRKLKFGGYLVEIQDAGKRYYMYRLDVNGYDPETHEYIKFLSILKWKVQKVIEFEGMVKEYPRFVNRGESSFLPGQTRIAAIMAHTFTCRLLLELIEANAKMRLAHLKIIDKQVNEMLDFIKGLKC